GTIISQPSTARSPPSAPPFPYTTLFRSKASAERLAPTDSAAKVDVLTSGQIQNLSTKGRNSFELLRPFVERFWIWPDVRTSTLAALSVGANLSADALDRKSVV